MITEGILTLTPVFNFNCSSEITVSVSDLFLEDSETFILTVNPVNDAPVLSEIGDQGTLEDTPLSINLESSDVDGDSLIYSVVSSSPLDVSVILDGSELTLTPALNFNGSVDILSLIHI